MNCIKISRPKLTAANRFMLQLPHYTIDGLKRRYQHPDFLESFVIMIFLLDLGKTFTFRHLNIN